MKRCLYLFVLLAAQLPAVAVPAGDRRPAKQGGPIDPAEKARAQLVEQVTALEVALEKIAAHKAYQPLFESEDGVVIQFQAQFSLAHKAVHDAVLRLEDDNALDHGLADRFHNHLREYRMNVEALNPAEYGDKLLDNFDDAVKLANKIPALTEVSVAGVRADATPREAVLFAQRSLAEAYWLLNHRTLTHVTSNGTQASHDLRAALDEVSAALDALTDDNGERVMQRDYKDEPLADQLASLKAALKEAHVQAKFYRQHYLPNARRYEHGLRARAIEARLAPDGFQKSLLAVKALKAPPPAPVAADSPKRQPNDARR